MKHFRAFIDDGYGFGPALRATVALEGESIRSWCESRAISREAVERLIGGSAVHPHHSTRQALAEHLDVEPELIARLAADAARDRG